MNNLSQDVILNPSASLRTGSVNDLQARRLALYWRFFVSLRSLRMTCAFILLAIFLTSCAPEPPSEPPSDTDAAAAIRAVMDAQVEAWNRGDIEAFMEGYAHTDSLRFASGSRVRRGWQTTLERYQTSYPDREAMGTLAFTDLDIDVLSEDRSLVFGRWRLGAEEEAPHGLFTLIFAQRMVDGEPVWRIIHDHTSAAM